MGIRPQCNPNLTLPNAVFYFYIMKRFLVFFGDIYYPKGGMQDFIGDFETLKECTLAIEVKLLSSINDTEIAIRGEEKCIKEELESRWYHVYDTATSKYVHYSDV